MVKSGVVEWLLWIRAVIFWGIVIGTTVLIILN
jgi:hypothetical protein